MSAFNKALNENDPLFNTLLTNREIDGLLNFLSDENTNVSDVVGMLNSVNVPNNMRNIAVNNGTIPLGSLANNYNSNTNNKSNRNNANLKKGNTWMKIQRKNFGKTGTANVKGRYRSSTSCHRLPMNAVNKLAKNRNILPARHFRPSNATRGSQKTSRPSLCRKMYGFGDLYDVARHFGITKTEKHKTGRRYKTVEEIEKEVRDKIKREKINAKYSYKNIVQRGLGKGKFKNRGKGSRVFGSLD